MKRTALLLLLILGAACGDAGNPAGTQHVESPWDIAFAGDTAGATYMYRTTGGTTRVRRIADTVRGTGPQARHDGGALLYTAPGEGGDPPFLALLASPTTKPTRFGTPDGVYEREARWSRDGTRVAFTSHRDDAYGDILVENLVASSLVTRTNLTGANGGAGVADVTPAWSPDGQRIAFTSYRSGNPSIWVMNADGSQPRQVTASGDWGDYFPTWSSAGDTLAFQRLDGQSARIGLVAVSGGEPRFLALPAKAFAPTFSPHLRDVLAVVMEVDGERDVHVIRTSGAILARVRRAGNDALPSWIRTDSPF